MQNSKHSVPDRIVLIGASTGGPGQIQRIITALPKLNGVTIIIAQHMTKGFIPNFMNRLKQYTNNGVSMAENNQDLFSDFIYFCSGDTTIIKNNFTLSFSNKDALENTYNPDINILFHSAVVLMPHIKILSVILTGIGDDGVNGCKALSEHGGKCITETQQSAIVDGMTSRARQHVPNITALDIKDIIQTIKEFCS